MRLKTVTLTMGEENFQPQRYEGFRVGPISITIEMDDNDTMDKAVTEGLKILKPAYDKMFLAQRDKYVEHHAAKW
jgi:hypothetical protein